MIRTVTAIPEGNFHSVDFNEVIRQSIDRLRYTEGIDKVNFDIKVDMKAPFSGNNKLLEVVFNNLISNGIKYRKITGDPSSMRLHVYCDEQKAIINIQDNGLGIAPDEVGKIFDLFQKEKQPEPGRGIGLYMAKEIIEKLGGNIAVESVLNTGTAFTIEIPNKLNTKPLNNYFE